MNPLTRNGAGSFTVEPARLPASALRVLRTLGLSGPEVRLRFWNVPERADQILVCSGEDDLLTPSADQLRQLGVSFVTGDSVTVLCEDGSPRLYPRTVSVSEYEGDPSWFHSPVMSALLLDPAAEDLVLGLLAVWEEYRVPTGSWLYLEH